MCSGLFDTVNRRLKGNTDGAAAGSWAGLHRLPASRFNGIRGGDGDRGAGNRGITDHERRPTWRINLCDLPRSMEPHTEQTRLLGERFCLFSFYAVVFVEQRNSLLASDLML